MKHFLKTVLALICATSMLLALVGCRAMDKLGILFLSEIVYDEVSDFDYTLNEDGESYAVVNLPLFMGYDIVIPDTYNEKPITVVGGEGSVGANDDLPFYNITLPDTVTRIEYKAFYANHGLDSVRLPDSLEYIGPYAFADCSLTEITIPGGRIEDHAFYESDLSYLTCLEGVTYIGDFAFSGFEAWSNPQMYNYLHEVTLPNTLTHIGKQAFADQIELKSIVIPKSVTYMGEDVFDECDSLTDIYCEAQSMPKQWETNWLGYCNATVHWGYTE